MKPAEIPYGHGYRFCGRCDKLISTCPCHGSIVVDICAECGFIGYGKEVEKKGEEK